MADPVGILSFALHAAHKTYNAVQTVKDAPDDVRMLRREADHVRGFLQDVISVLQTDQRAQQGRAQTQFRALIEEARELTETTNTFLDKTTTRQQDGSYRVRKAKWLVYGSSVLKLADSFAHFNQTLCAVLCTHNMYASPPRSPDVIWTDWVTVMSARC